MHGHRKIKVYEDDGSVKETTVYLPQIRDVVGFLNGVWDLKMYADCFEGNNKLGDVDASIERYGWTLHIEFKRSRDDLNSGQLLKAINQARFSDITTFFIFGETNRPVECLKISPMDLRGSIKPVNVMEVSKLFTEWEQWAKKNSKLSRKNLDWDIVKQYVKKR
jgi:hypothetical protein